MKQTKPWVRFFSILGFISSGFMILAGIFMIFVAMATQQAQFIVIAVLYPLIGILYVFPALYLFRYASNIGEFLRSRRQEHLEEALGSQKSFWKFIGIMSVIMLILYVLFFIVYFVYMIITGP